MEYDQYAWNQLDHLVLPAGSFLLCGREFAPHIYFRKRLLERTHNRRNAYLLGEEKPRRSTGKGTFAEEGMERHQKICSSSI